MAGPRSTEELEAEIGRHLRARRIESGLRQSDLADRANIAVVTLSHLESGKGANLTTLVKVVRALDAEEWIDALEPDQPFSPLAALEASRNPAAAPQRRRVRRSTTDGALP